MSRLLPYATGVLLATLGFAPQRHCAPQQTSGVPAKPAAADASHGISGSRAHKPLTIYGPPAPVPIDGPSLPPEQEFDRDQARRLLDHLRAGRLRLTVPDREEGQLRTIALAGRFFWPVPPPNTKLLDPGQQRVLADTALPDTAKLRAEQHRPDLASRAASQGNRKQIPTIASELPAFDPLSQPPAPALLRMLEVLAAHSTPSRPLELMSLLRPPYRIGGFIHVGPLNPHSLGLAADIASYGGCDIRQDQPESCVTATLALLRALPPGRYRLGVPKAPETPLFVGRRPLPPVLAGWLPTVKYTLDGGGDAAPDCVTAALMSVTLDEPKPQPWPFFPAPMPVLEQGRIAPLLKAGKPVLGADHRQIPAIARYRNEDYAPIELQDVRLRQEIAAANERGVEIIAAFPDGADHIHIDVRQHP